MAEVFGKGHDDLLRVTRKIDKENQVVNLRSFAAIKYVDSRGREQDAFEMTETGFFALVARFNDQKDTDISLVRACYFKEFDRIKKNKAISQAGKLFDVSGRSVASAKTVLEDGTPKLKVQLSANLQQAKNLSTAICKKCGKEYDVGPCNFGPDGCPFCYPPEKQPYASNQYDNKAVSHAGKMFDVSGRDTPGGHADEENQVVNLRIFTHIKYVDSQGKEQPHKTLNVLSSLDS